VEELLLKSKVNKILILSEYVNPNDNSTGYFWSKLIDRLSHDIVGVGVIAPVEDDGIAEFKHDSLFSFWGFRRRIYNKNSLLQRFRGQLRLVYDFVIQLRQRVSSGDILLTGTNPALLLVTLPLIKSIFRFRWIVLIHDVYPENLVAAGLIRRESLVFDLLYRYMSGVYSKADAIYVIGRDMQSKIASMIGSESRVRYIPNWVDADDIAGLPKDKSDILKNCGFDACVVFQFFGNFGRVQGIQNLLDAIQLTRSTRAAFIFIGDGVLLNKVKQFADGNPDKKIVYYGSIRQSEKNLGLNACDIAMVTLEKGMTGLGVPSKAYFSMAADRPILAVMAQDSEIAKTVTNHGIGWVCEPGNPIALADLIDAISESGRCQTANSPREIFEKNYSSKILLDQFSSQIFDFANANGVLLERRVN
jgi:glycosyltransferase involved in cell wall biosynthesis